MITRVIVNNQLLVQFRKKVILAYPKEYMETLWGKIEGSSVIITSFRPVHQRASEESVQYTEGDAVAHAGHGELYIGTCHSHPDCQDATPSQEDWNTSFSSGEHMFGVMRVTKKSNGKFETQTEFWEPRPRISIVYPRIREARKAKVVEVTVAQSL